MNYNNLLENNQLQFQEAVSGKFMCVLCRKVLREAHTVPCGHSYCFSCIRDHIKNENTFCIGTDSECKLEPLDLSKNVLKDFRLNNEIIRLNVKCFNNPCSDFVELKNLELHMQSCRFKITACPFEIVGCTVRGLIQNDLKDHLVQSSLDHATIMTKYVEELKNKNDELLLKIDRMQQQFEQRDNEVSQNITNLESKIMEEIENKITTDKQELENKMTTDKNELKNKMTTDKKELENKMTTKIKELNNKIKTENEESEKKFNLIKEELKKLSNQIKEGNDKKIKRMNIGENYVAVDKEVKVTFDNMSGKKRDQDYTSDLFILERYSFKLGMIYKWNDYIVFYMNLVKGEYDEEVSWPMKRTVQMNILNCDGNLYTCHEFNYDIGIKNRKGEYNKPNGSILIWDSNIAVYYNRILNNNTVTVIVKMID